MDEARTRIAENLRNLLKSKGIRNKDVAEFLGVSTAAVAKWMTGSNGIDIENLVKICRYLGADLNEILGYEPKKKVFLNQDEDHLLNVFRLLDDLGRSKLTEYADDLAASGRYVRTGSEKDA